MKLLLLLSALLIISCASTNELELLNKINTNLENKIKKTTNKRALNKLKVIKNHIQYQINNFNQSK